MISSEEDRELYRAPLFPWMFPTQAVFARCYRLSELAAMQTNRMDDSSFNDYSDKVVRASVVHARQDIGSYLTLFLGHHRQLVNISRGVWALVALAGYALWRLM